MEEAVECDGGDPGLVARRDRLHRRDVYEGREAHVRHNLLHRVPLLTQTRNWLCERGWNEKADQMMQATPARILGIDSSCCITQSGAS